MRFCVSGNPLPLASLRLLVPPFQLMTASMWQVLKKQDVMNYWKVAEFVSLVMDMVPELLMYKHRTQLNLGLRARVGTSGGHERGYPHLSADSQLIIDVRRRLGHSR